MEPVPGLSRWKFRARHGNVLEKRIFGACREEGEEEETAQRRERTAAGSWRKSPRPSFRTLIVKQRRTSQTGGVRVERVPDRLCLNKFTCRTLSLSCAIFSPEKRGDAKRGGVKWRVLFLILATRIFGSVCSRDASETILFE